MDGDKKGKDERDKYIKEYGLEKSRIATLDELIQNVTVIEDLLDEEANNIISSDLGLSSNPSKKHIRRYFQECLARDEIPSLGTYFEKHSKLILEELQSLLDKER